VRQANAAPAGAAFAAAATGWREGKPQGEGNAARVVIATTAGLPGR
jgi:hypothetical protein